MASVELGSFTAAGKQFRISPAMVSKQIAALEHSLGATLLQRTTRSKRLTDIGKHYYENSKKLLEDLEQLNLNVEAATKSPRGLLRVTSSVWYGSHILAPVICNYLKQYEDVDIELSLTERFVDIVNEGFDVAVRIGELEDSSLKARKLGQFRLTICASPDYLQRKGTPHTPEDLLKHTCLGFSGWRNLNALKQVQRQISTKQRFDSNNGQALLMAGLQGIGLVLLPENLIRAHLQNRCLIQVMTSYDVLSKPIHALYPSGKQVSSKVASFISYLSDHLQSDQGIAAD